MNKPTALFFVFLYLVAMLRPIQPYVEYILNKDYIAEFLCVNKDKPALHCDGQCYLMKQIQKQQKEQSTPLKISIENYPIGFVNILKIQPTQFYSISKNSIFLYSKLYFFDYNSNAFQPPELA